MGFNRLSFMRTFLLSCALFVCSSFALHAAQGGEPVSAKIVAEERAVQPGRPFWVGIELKMAKGWDTYWLNPGDSGFATQVSWDLPSGFKASPLLWPFPEKFITESLVAFGYKDTVMLMAEITPPTTLSSQTVSLKADVNWLACNESCVPGSASLNLSLPVTHSLPGVDPVAAPLFSKAREALPQKEETLSVSAHSNQITIAFKPDATRMSAIDHVLFIPEQPEIVDYAAPQNFKAQGGELALDIKKIDAQSELSALKGVLIISEKGEATRAIQVDHPIVSQAATIASVEGVSSLTMALVFAFLGGLILNVMPCVLPVVALKIFGFVKMSQQKRGLIFKHGALFSFGVVLSFWVLSGALLVLRAYGEGIGWGFQLQEPIFVAILAGLLFLLGLSLFGVFEMGTSLISLGSKTSTSSSPLASSFMSGVLATLVATPCTGPLLGPALGFAMTLPPLKALIIFTSMGIGMASPYLIFSAFPHLVRYLPKPGNWMIAFKQIMGFLMMATVVWLIWVFGAQTDNMATFVLLVSLLLMAIGAWVFGKWGALTRKKMTRIVASLLAALIVFTGGGAAIVTAKQHRDIVNATPLAADQQGWEAYSPERVEALRAAGVPVFIDFTAKWCLICQANKVILHSSEIQKAFKERGVVTMIADWTKRDAIITEQLEKLGRTGVPVYVLYSGDLTEKPYILPQTLSANVIHQYLDKLEQTATVHAD